MADWVIFGGGGHARVVADAIKLTGENVIAYFDDNKSLAFINDIPVYPYNENIAMRASIIVGIGNNELRRNISKRIAHSFKTVIHPKAIIAGDVIIGEGSVILAGAVIQSGAVIGRHVVINANVTIDHDAQIGDYCSIYPNAYIGGEARIGAGVTVNACTAVARLTQIPGILVTDDVVELDLY